MPAPKDQYLTAVAKLASEGFALDPKTCFFVRGAERLKLRWNGRVYARRRGPPAPQLELVFAQPDDPIVTEDFPAAEPAASATLL